MKNMTLKRLECENVRMCTIARLQDCTTARGVREAATSCHRVIRENLIFSSSHLPIFSSMPLLVLLLLSKPLTAQEWIVPPDKGKTLSSFSFTDETRKAGEVLYTTNCKSCHGDPGKGNVLKSVPPPTDPGSAKMQKNADGEMFFKISEGRSLMPAFKNILSSTDIWRIISYIRSFNDQYKQQVAQKPEGAAAGKTKITVNWIKDKYQVETVLLNEVDSVVKPLEGEQIQLFAERYFGDLPIDSIRRTGKDGKAYFNFPKGLPGDSAGNVIVSARLADEGKYGEVKSDTVIQAGLPTWKPPLNDQRAMWNIVQKTPLWLLFSYVGIVLSIWGVIFYVIYLLRVILITGSQRNINQDH